MVLEDGLKEVFMGDNFRSKNSLNNKLINITIFTLCLVIIFAIIVGVIIWQKTDNLKLIIFIPIGILGVLFNIYLLFKGKDKREK
jgi:Ni,Fe-hydrogenase I cytochrome b subunit